MHFKRLHILIFATILLTHAAYGQSKSSDSKFFDKLRAAGLIEGYLPSPALSEAVHLIPPPPPEGSPQEQYDRASVSLVVKTRSTSQIQQAINDADIRFPSIAASFRCALGVEISEAYTPHLYRLMRRSFSDFVLATTPIKAHYKRPRPFVVNSRPACIGKDVERLRNDGSYPSGHSAFGFGWALTLASVDPERTIALVQRGLEIGDGREACNVHWRSDIDQGRVLASIVFARLQIEQEFQRDINLARQEVQQLRGSIVPPDECRHPSVLPD